MRAPRFRGRRARRLWLLGTALTALATFAAVFVAASGANLTGSTFEGNDGNLVVDTAGNTDWVNAPNRVVGVDLPTGPTDNSFGQGTKEDNTAVTVVNGSIPNSKADLARFGVASEFVNGANYLYLAWTRENLSGTVNFDFEVNQAAQPDLTTPGPKTLVRTVGDLLINYSFQGGANTPTLTLRKWAGSAWGPEQTLSSSSSEGATNSAVVLDTLASPSINRPAQAFGEASINLTTAGVFPAGTCEAFGSAYVKSRSSSSFTSEIKDFIAPVPVNISNCGTIRIHKVTENGDSTFDYTTTGGLTPSSFQLSNGGTRTYGPGTVQPGNYSVSESAPPAGWTLKSLTCTATGQGTSASPSGATASITIAPGGVADCTYTNHLTFSPTIATTLSANPVPVGSTVHDSATLSGASPTAGGSVTYTVYTDSACSQNAQAAGTKTVTNGVVPDSDPITFNSAGDFYWQAVYSGDGANNGATSACTSEHLVVNKRNPTIATTLSDSTISVGGSVHDSSSLTGQTGDAGGSVTYTVYTDSACSQNARDAGTKTVTGGVVPDSNTLSFNQAGDFYWQAVYTGDANNNGATSACTSEHLVVNKRNPTIATTLSDSTISVGGSVHDSSTLSGQTGDAGGSVTYTVYTDSACTLNPRDAGTKTVTGGVVPDSDTLSFNQAGDFYWQAVYTGDANNNGATSTCTSEHLVVNKRNPTIATTLSDTTVPVGATVHDSSTLSGQTGDAGGSVTYAVYTDSSCTNIYSPAGTKGVSSGIVPDSDGVTFNQAGDFYWQAVYTGDANNNGATSACTSEHLVVNKRNPTIATTLSDTTVPVGSSVHDSSSLTGQTADAGGTVTYTVYSDNACTLNPRDAGTKTVSGGIIPDSNALAFNSAGDFYWQAVYTGDANNNGATSACTSEHLVVNKLNPSIATTLSATVVSIGSTVHDSATLSGATPDAGGTVTYTVYSDNACTQNPQGAGTEPVSNGIVPDSNGIVFDSAGDFYWQAVYSGDANNTGATSDCTSEHLLVNPNHPSASTAQNLRPNDSFTLSGATDTAGGSITFNLYGPGDSSCSGLPALTETVPVSGNGTYSTSNTSFLATAEGTWRWQSTYSGDANNVSATSSCGTERFTIANS